MIAIPWLSILRSKWLHYGLLALAVFGVFLWGKAGWRNADQWKSNYQVQRKAYVAEQAAARARLLAQKITTENKYAIVARRADAADETIRRLRSNADAYGVAHRVRLSPADLRARGIAPTAPDGTPSRDNGPSGPSDYVLVPAGDYTRYNALVDRMIRAHNWGEILKTEGLAIPEASFGGEIHSPTAAP